ncbi:MAG: hypothetical protein SV062_02005 [Thermodesulfobacteriota bacterium]|nr:hypothetical protein [Thermodesulfobacteriota bacterium]
MVRKTNKNVFVFFLCIVYFYFISPLSGKEKETCYYLNFKKSLKSDLALQYKLNKGDYLWKILRDQYKIPISKIIKSIKEIQKINPQITNLDLVHPDQTLLIPISVAQISPPFNHYLPLENYKKHLFKKGETLYGVMVRKYEVPKSVFFNNCYPIIKKLNPDIKDFNKLSVGQEVFVTVLKKDRKLERNNEDNVIDKRDFDLNRLMKRSIGKVFDRLGENFVANGKIFISTENGYKIKLDAAQSPLIKTEGSNIILNFTKEPIPKELRENILTLKDYKIVDIDRKENAKQVMDVLLRKAGYDQVVRKQPVIIGDQITVSITGDWVVIKDISKIPPEFHVINFIDSKGQATSPYLKGYFNKHRLKVIDIIQDTDKKLEGRGTFNEKIRPECKEEKILSREVLVDSILAYLGERFQSTSNVEILFKSEQDIGNPCIVRVDRLLCYNDRNFVINFKDTRDSYKKLFAGYGFNSLDIKKEEEPNILIRNLLDFLEIELPEKKVEIKSENKQHCRVTLKIPGIMLHQERKEFLLTDIIIDKDIASYLANKGYTIIEY